MRTRAFVVEREIRIRAQRERVFELFSSREGLALWMPVAILQPHIGGSVEFRFVRDDGDELIAIGEITAYDPPSRFVFSWDFKDDPLDARTEVTIEFIADGDATFVRLTHIGFVDQEEAAKHAEGWEYWLGRLKASGESEDRSQTASASS